jgi:hypothetical protein
MKRSILFGVAAGSWLLSGLLFAHDVTNMAHTHAFKQTGYGTYRQGHSVNGPNGSIIIYSARPYTGYQSSPNVKFARPEPITRAPGSVIPNSKIASDPAQNYGKRQKSDYGN